MKIITNGGKQTFKKVSAKQVELFPALASKLGVQRPEVLFDLPRYEASDLDTFTPSQIATVVECLNDALVTLAKGQFAAQPTDWNFKPTIESLSLEALAASFESVSKGRVLTLESAKKLAEWLTRNMAKLVQGIQKVEPAYKPEQASAIIGVVLQYTKYEAKTSEFLAKVVMRLNQMIEAILEDDDLAVEFSEDGSMANVFEALIKKFSKEIADEITEDAL